MNRIKLWCLAVVWEEFNSVTDSDRMSVRHVAFEVSVVLGGCAMKYPVVPLSVQVPLSIGLSCRMTLHPVGAIGVFMKL